MEENIFSPNIALQFLYGSIFYYI